MTPSSGSGILKSGCPYLGSDDSITVIVRFAAEFVVPATAIPIAASILVQCAIDLGNIPEHQ